MTARKPAAAPDVDGRPARGSGSLRPDPPRRTRVSFRQLVERVPDVVYRVSFHPPRLEFGSGTSRLVAQSGRALRGEQLFVVASGESYRDATCPEHVPRQARRVRATVKLHD